MVSREQIDQVLTKTLMVKCTLKDKLKSFQKNMEKYRVDDVEIAPIEITPELIITDESEIKNMKHIEVDKYKDGNGDPILYGALELHQDQLQKRVTYEPNEFGAVNNFACQEYKLINGSIYKTDYYKERKRNNPNIDEWVNMRKENLDSAIDRSPPLDIDTTFYRYGDFPSGLRVGDTGKFKGYTSTTYQEKTAERFKDGYDHDSSGRYKITIKAPKGTKGVLLNDTFEGVKEHEFLLGRNQKYMVLEVNDDTHEVVIGLY